jgi:hypothetical protein
MIPALARRAVIAFALLMSSAAAAAGAERYALIVTGAAGGDDYAQKYDAWRTSLVDTLRQKFAYPEDHLLVLAEQESAGVRKATRENVRAALADLRARAQKDDVVLIVLIGHGTSGDGDEAKFNLVGPDLTVDEWAGLVAPISARVVFVNTTSGSFPFLKKLASPGHIVLTATDNPAQQFETVFPDYFVKSFNEEYADQDKNGKVSLWEAFVYASAKVLDYYEQRGQLPTERPLLDDTGGGSGRDVETAGPDGPVAQVTYLQPDVVIAETGDAELTRLLRRRAELESQLEQVKARKPNMSADDYDTELEKVLLELARVDRDIRTRQKS